MKLSYQKLVYLDFRLKETIEMRLLLLIVSFVYCAATLAFADTALPASNPFTTPLDQFKASEKNENVKIYLMPGADFSTYHAVILDPLYYSNQNKEGAWELLASSEQDQISAYFLAHMNEELEKAGVTVVNEAGPGVLRLRVLVTGLDKQRPGIEPLDVFPLKALFNLGRMAVGAEPYLVKMGSLGQLEDSQSGAILGAKINSRVSKSSTTKDEQITLKVLQSAIDDWCKDAAKFINEAMHMSKAN